jgi:hypothetical protein
VSSPWEEPAGSRPAQEIDAETLLRMLVESGVEFVVVGGLAVAFHGYARATKDVDIVPGPDSANLRRLYDVLELLEAEPIEVGDFRPGELPVPFTADGLGRGGNWALRTRAGRLDVLQWLAGVEGFHPLRERAVEATLPNIGRVLFASFEDLLAMKRAAGRGIDREDIAALEEARREPET